MQDRSMSGRRGRKIDILLTSIWIEWLMRLRLGEEERESIAYEVKGLDLGLDGHN